MTEERLTDAINEFFGVDAMYYGVDSRALAHHLMLTGSAVSNEEALKELRKSKQEIIGFVVYAALTIVNLVSSILVFIS